MHARAVSSIRAPVPARVRSKLHTTYAFVLLANFLWLIQGSGEGAYALCVYMPQTSPLWLFVSVSVCVKHTLCIHSFARAGAGGDGLGPAQKNKNEDGARALLCFLNHSPSTVVTSTFICIANKDCFVFKVEHIARLKTTLGLRLLFHQSKSVVYRRIICACIFVSSITSAWLRVVRVKRKKAAAAAGGADGGGGGGGHSSGGASRRKQQR